MTILEKTNSPRTRVSIDNLSDGWTDQRARGSVHASLDYHDGNDRYYIEDKMADRFATEVIKTKNKQTGELETHQIRSQHAKRVAIQNHFYEATPRKIHRKITTWVGSLANTSVFTYTKDGKPDEEFQQDMQSERQNGAFALAFARTDQISVMVGSCIMMPQVINDSFNYQPIPPSKVWVPFGESIKQDSASGEEIDRPVNKLRLEDALAVVVHLGEKNYVAYFGRSTDYPQGRRVEYEAESWDTIPEPYDDSATTRDYIGDSGEIANPLTEWQDKQGDFTSPEYPIIVWQGDSDGIGKELIPVSDTLYLSSLEIDLSASRTSMSANKGARGAWMIENGIGASTAVPQAVDEGLGTLKEGQKMVVLTVPSGNIAEARNTNEADADYLSDAYGIPPYLMSLSKNTQVPSGEALIQANKPLEWKRKERYAINRDEMKRLFDIEMALAGIEGGEPVNSDVKQNWMVLPMDVQKTKVQLLEEAKLERELGIIDEAEMLVRVNPDIETREEAEAYLKSLNLAPAVEAPTGTLGALGIV